jgi:hypothetical protein
MCTQTCRIEFLLRSTILSPTLNPGAVYFAEAQYVTPHEYAWCQTHPGQCNIYNNASYRQFSVTGTNPPFSFSAVGSTVQMQPAIEAWAGATINQIEPDPGNDGIGLLGCKVTSPSARHERCRWQNSLRESCVILRLKTRLLNVATTLKRGQGVTAVHQHIARIQTSFS